MTETEELEAWNAEFNRRIAERPVTNPGICLLCHGKGKHINRYSVFARNEPVKCHGCNGMKYLDADSQKENACAAPA